ncbi:MAG: hypothetical protein ABJC74_05420 [Gemmatimonadota bacterium]
MTDWWDRLPLPDKLRVTAVEGLLCRVPPWMVAALYEAAAILARSGNDGPPNVS